MLDNPRWEHFAQKYAELHDIGDAYMAAYPRVKSRATARANGCRLLAKATVSDRARELLEASLARAEVTIDDVVEEIRRVAFARLPEIVEFDDTGMRVKPSTELRPEEAAALAEFTETVITLQSDETQEVVKRTRKLKMHPKLEALEKLMKRLNAYPPQQVDLTSKGDKIPLAVFAAALAAGGEPPTNGG